MSVFKKLKGRFQTAQQGLFDGLRSVSLLDGHLKSDQLHHIKSKEIDLNAGADLLFEYQETWAKFQNETKLCSDKAGSVDDSLSSMFLVWDKRAEDVTALEEEVKSIPLIMSTFKDIHSLLDSIRQEFSVVESSLCVLENICEEVDLKKAMENETKKLNDYEATKDKEVEKIKVNLAQAHAKRMQEFESKKHMKMKERAEAFTTAFEEDVNYYKTHGETESKLVKEFPKVSSLSQIEIEEDNKELDSFLGPPIDEEPGTAVVEEQYFEDDYTENFSIKKDMETPDDEDLKTARSELVDSYNYDDSKKILENKGAYHDSYLVPNHVVSDDLATVEGEDLDVEKEEEIKVKIEKNDDVTDGVDKCNDSNKQESGLDDGKEDENES